MRVGLAFPRAIVRAESAAALRIVEKRAAFTSRRRFSPQPLDISGRPPIEYVLLFKVGNAGAGPRRAGRTRCLLHCSRLRRRRWREAGKVNVRRDNPGRREQRLQVVIAFHALRRNTRGYRCTLRRCRAAQGCSDCCCSTAVGDTCCICAQVVRRATPRRSSNDSRDVHAPPVDYRMPVVHCHSGRLGSYCGDAQTGVWSPYCRLRKALAALSLLSCTSQPTAPRAVDFSTPLVPQSADPQRERRYTSPRDYSTKCYSYMILRTARALLRVTSFQVALSTREASSPHRPRVVGEM